MKTVLAFIKRNTKMFFKDKGLFFTSLITPLILLMLYISFLGNVYYTSFEASIPAELGIDPNIIDGCVGGQLMSSLLSVSCVTVAFCSNMLMVQDKVSGANNDFAVSPTKRSHLALGYYISAALTTLLTCLVAMVACFIYIKAMDGWFLTVSDVLYLVLDTFIMVMFGTALSSIINFFLSSQGQISAVGTIVSTCYGFICGAYMPISEFSEGLQKVISFLPGTYGTSLFRNHAMGSAIEKLQESGVTSEMVNEIKDAFDCNVYFFENKVSTGVSLGLVFGVVVLLIAVYVLLNIFKGGKARSK